MLRPVMLVNRPIVSGATKKGETYRKRGCGLGGKRHFAPVSDSPPSPAVTPLRAPSVSLLEGAALFLDFDGTLAPIADTPCGVEVDEVTARVRIDKYVTMHGAGRRLNPALVDGQIRGAFAHAVTHALTNGGRAAAIAQGPAV